MNIGTNGKTSINNYKKSLEINQIDYKNVSWNGLDAVEYSFKQDFDGVSVPTIALFGFKKEKLFLIQLASLSDSQEKFTLLKKSIVIL